MGTTAFDEHRAKLRRSFKEERQATASARCDGSASSGVESEAGPQRSATETNELDADAAKATDSTGDTESGRGQTDLPGPEQTRHGAVVSVDCAGAATHGSGEEQYVERLEVMAQSF